MSIANVSLNDMSRAVLPQQVQRTRNTHTYTHSFNDITHMRYSERQVIVEQVYIACANTSVTQHTNIHLWYARGTLCILYIFSSSFCVRRKCQMLNACAGCGVRGAWMYVCVCVLKASAACEYPNKHTTRSFSTLYTETAQHQQRDLATQYRTQPHVYPTLYTLMPQPPTLRD